LTRFPQVSGAARAAIGIIALLGWPPVAVAQLWIVKASRITMTKRRTLIGAVTVAHFVLYLTVLGLIRVTGAIFLVHLFLCLSFPLILLPYTRWLPFDWFQFGLAALLNSSVWGLIFGLLIYALRRRFF
jgi:hypothetical protein